MDYTDEYWRKMPVLPNQIRSTAGAVPVLNEKGAALVATQLAVLSVPESSSQSFSIVCGMLL